MSELVFSERAKRFGSNIFNVLNDMIIDRKEQGLGVYNFTVGTPDFPPDKHILEAVSKASLNPENYKYSLGDSKRLLDAVKNWYKKRYDVELCDDEITSVYGTQEGMAHIALAICNPGDTILVPNPGYPIFEIGPYLSGANVCYYDLLPENDYLIDFDALDEDLLIKAKAIVVSYPLNPVCATAPDAFYEKLIRIAKKYNLIVIHDNAYSEIIYDGASCGSFLHYDGAMDVGVEFNSLSKTYNLTGLRISFLLGNKEIIKHFKAVRSQIDYGTSFIVQEAAIAALTGPQDSIKERCLEYEKRRDALAEGLSKVGLIPCKDKGSMFLWAKISDENISSNDYVIKLFNETGILCTPGSSFGTLGNGYVRFALVLPAEKIKEIFALL